MSASPDATVQSVVAVVIRLVRQLRSRGLSVTPGSSVDAVQALALIDVVDRDEVRHALRVVLVSRPEDREAFDAMFDAVWDAAAGVVAAGAPRALTLPHVADQSSKRTAQVTLQNWMKPDEGMREEPMSLMAPSDDEVLASRDFSTWQSTDAQAFRRLAQRVARRLALRRSRRWKGGPRGRAIDLRGTMRGSVRTAGELLRVARRTRRVRRTRILALCDVSGSMELYSRFLLQFLHALQNTFAFVETFVFATRVSRVTDQMRGTGYEGALRQLGRDVRDWSGGTRIGHAVEAIVATHHRRLDRRTIVLILSDGWDVGDPAVLEHSLAELRRRVGKVIWLNPLMGAADYTPATRGMRTALEHIDLLAPAHNLEALERLVPRLVV